MPTTLPVRNRPMSAKSRRSIPVWFFALPPRPEPTRDEIAACAVFLWEEEGRPQGRDLDLWLLAEMRLRQGCKVPAVAGRSGVGRCQSDDDAL